MLKGVWPLPSTIPTPEPHIPRTMRKAATVGRTANTTTAPITSESLPHGFSAWGAFIPKSRQHGLARHHEAPKSAPPLRNPVPTARFQPMEQLALRPLQCGVFEPEQIPLKPQAGTPVSQEPQSGGKSRHQSSTPKKCFCIRPNAQQQRPPPKASGFSAAHFS